MKISLTEIWNFIDLIKADDKGWDFGLHAGTVNITGLSPSLLVKFKKDENYDSEILPSIFTFREILWQPDIFTESQSSLPGLRILNAHCQEIAEELRNKGTDISALYAQLIDGLGICCQKALTGLDGKPGQVAKILGDFRVEAFPIVKFFIFHPMNRADYYKDAVNRLNYAVKVMLTQFHGRYTALEDPYWLVQFHQEEKSKKVKQSAEENGIKSI